MDSFRTKTAARQFVSAYLKRYAGRTECVRLVDADELAWAQDLLVRHPNWAAKARGLEWIGVHAGHFCLVSQAGQHHEDISFHKCLTPPTPRSELMRACRTAIQPQVTAYRRAASYPATCAMSDCAAVLQADERTHVDHVRPFVCLVDAWLGDRDPASIPTLSTGTARAFAPAAAADEESWRAYHAEHAQLRLVCAHCNLTRPRS